VSEFIDLDRGERILSLVSLGSDGLGLALGTAAGVVKRVMPEVPSNRDRWALIGLKEGDVLVGAAPISATTDELVFVTSDAQLLRFAASAVRPQGRAAGGMAGIRLDKNAKAVFFGVVPPDQSAVVVTVAGHSAALPGTDAGSAKVTPLDEYPSKGRGTGGLRCHRFLKGEDTLLIAWAGHGPARAAAATGVPVDLPAPVQRRDGSGVSLPQPIAAVAGPVQTPRA
jgi:DNA gyrase subunit A